MLRPALAATLDRLSRLADAAGVSPVLFGTAVLELRGIGGFRATDLDVIAEVDEAKALARAAGVEPGGESGDDRFSSLIHLHLGGAPLTIDVMAAMRVRTPAGWTLYQPETVELIAAGRPFRAVSLADLRRFYRLADRPKDRGKIAALEAALAERASNSI